MNDFLAILITNLYIFCQANLLNWMSKMHLKQNKSLSLNSTNTNWDYEFDK